MPGRYQISPVHAAVFALCWVLVCSCRGASLPDLVPAGEARLVRISAAALSPGADYLALGTDGGELRLWDLVRGRQVFFSPAPASPVALAGIRFTPHLALELRYASGREEILVPQISEGTPVVQLSVDGSAEKGEKGVLVSYEKKRSLHIQSDGSLILRDGKDLARLFCFENTSGAWLCAGPGGFYHCSEGADRLLVLKGREGQFLANFAGGLFRPDLLETALAGSGKPARPALKALLKRTAAPPEIQAGEPVGLPDGAGEITVTIREQKGGEGILVLYRDLGASGSRETPLAVYLPELPTDKKAQTHERTLRFPLEPGENRLCLGVFNRDGTVESSRLRFSLRGGPLPLRSTGVKPALYGLCTGTPASAELEALFALQEKGELYRSAMLYGSLDDFRSASVTADDVVFVFAGLSGKTNTAGDFVFENGSTADDLLAVLPNPGKTVFFLDMLLDIGASGSPAAETALLRLSRKLESLLALPAADGFPLARSLFAAAAGGDRQYLDAAELFGRMGVFLEAEDLRPLVSFSGPPFPLVDTLAGRPAVSGTGGSSGTGGAGSGRGFSPAMFAGGSSGGTLRGPRPGFGVSFAELNPSNYQKFDPQVLEAMGMEQYMIVYLSGQNAYREGQYDKAIGEYTRSIGLNGNYANVYAARGNAWARKGDLTKAIDDYTRALRIQSSFPAVYNYRGFAYASKGDLVRAIDDYTQAIRYDGRFADAYYNRAHAYTSRKEWEKAITDYTRVIELEPQNDAAYNRRGSAWYNQDNDDRAISDFNEALRLQPGNAVYFYNRGNAWYSKGDWDKALADLNQAIKLDSRLAAAYQSRARVWQKKGDEAKAAADTALAERMR